MAISYKKRFFIFNLSMYQFLPRFYPDFLNLPAVAAHDLYFFIYLRFLLGFTYSVSKNIF